MSKPEKEPSKAPQRQVSKPEKGKLAIKGASLEWIAADAFTVDPSYDRPANEERINHMAENWKDEALGVVFSSRREDEPRLYLLDGQHRVGALVKQGRKTDLVPTLVFEGLTVAQEAELFVMMNKNRRPPSPSELFRASLVEGNKGAIEIQQVFDSLGLNIESFNGDQYTVRCVATLWRVYRAMGASGIDATLSLILLSWGDPPPDNAFSQYLVLTLGRILYFNENRIDMDRMRQVLSKETPNTLLTRAQAIRHLQGGDRTRVLTDVILTAYNKGLAASRQLNPETMRPKKDPFSAATRFRRGSGKDGDE